MDTKIILFNLLTLLLLSAASPVALSSYVTQEREKTYLRWKLSAAKSQVSVKREGQRVLLKTSDGEFFARLKKQIQGLARDGQYMERIEFDSSGKENGMFSILVRLKENIELFAFYRDREKKHIIDFWKETGEVVAKKSPKPPVTVRPIKSIRKAKPIVQKVVTTPAAVVGDRQEYRDFRYGASFYWDYEPLEVHFKKIIDLRSKTPEFFYPIEDRDYKKSDKEAHLQLSINMYRKRKWGLMYNSIKLYREKYGESDNFETNEYLKANAIIRDNFHKKEQGPAKAALNILDNIEKKSTNYALQKGIVKYSLQYHFDNGDYVAALKSAKSLYVMAVEKNDDRDARMAAQAILFGLSKLNQVAEIQKILEEKDMVKHLSKNTVLLYEIYSYLRMGKSKRVVAIYEREKNNFATPLHESILFNVAEAAFREVRFGLALELFDKFIASYSYHTYSSQARVRLALIYELTEKPFKEVAFLYKNAINRSQNMKSSLEAKIRYVALNNIRKINPGQKDKESRLFLKIDEKEHEYVDANIKKILWIVRTRLLIQDKKYQDAMAYLKTIPMAVLKPVEKRVFESEGAEIVYGIINNLYKDSKYSEIVKFWNIYKDKYLSKIAKDSTMNFIVGKSYLKLGLYDEFDNVYKKFTKLEDTPEKTFPLWVQRQRSRPNFEIIQELMIEKNLSLGNLELAQRELDILKNKNAANEKIGYYQGVILYREKKYKKSAKRFESFLSDKKNKGILSSEEVGMMLMSYTDAIYKQGDMNKFKRVSQAILKDTGTYAPDSKMMKNLRERLSYLVIEIKFAENDSKDYLQLSGEIHKFKKSHKGSIYADRVDYILGSYYVKNQKPEEAKKIFNKILSNEDVSKNVKGLVRAELAMLSIQEKNL